MTIHSQHGPRRRLAGVIATTTLTVAGFGAVTAASSATAVPARASEPSSAYAGGRYLVTFADEPAATYEGGIAGYPRTRPDSGKKLDPTRSEVVKYRARLAKIHDDALAAVGASKLYDYSVATNGVAVGLTGSQARKLAKSAGVQALELDALQTLETTESPAFLGLSDANGLWSQLGGNTAAGAGVIVGVIDSGIWPESASFSGAELKRDKAGQPVAATGLRGKWFGACVQGEQFSSQNCNDKLIGARYYVSGFGKQNIAQEEYLSPRDGGGHGTHTASTAAGNRVAGATIDGTVQGTASGMAPGADVAAYKVCWEAKPGASGGCFNSDSIAAIDDAVADGVDVLNYSVGGSSESSPLDSVEQAYRRAANVGIFVAASAGNSGPGVSTLDHPSPWLTTVAASTFRSSQKAVLLGSGAEYVGASITATLPSKPLVRSAAAKLAGADATQASLCYSGTLDPALTTGKIVQCDRGVIDRVTKGFEVKRAGGVGMVLTNTGPNSLNSDFHAVPTVHVDNIARSAIIGYIEATAAPTAAIVTSSAPSAPVPDVAAFSSRGPSTTTAGDILKPDLSAPGVDVLASVAPPSNNGRSFDYYSGTSMSSPHIAGIGALIKAAHPTWSPMAVKSALMTSATDHATESGKDPFAQGAGFVRPNKAVDPGLVFGAGATDWRRYMVGLGVSFGAPFNTLTALTGSDLNQASIAIGSMAGRQTLTRTVTNVSGVTETYAVDAAVPGISVTGDTAPFSLDAGESKTLSLTFTRTTATLGTWAKGAITFSSSAHTVRIPVTIRPVAIAAPAEIAGTIADGSETFSVTPGFDGPMTTSVTGLVGATPTPGSVVSGEFVVGQVSSATKEYSLVVPAGATLVRFDVDATDDLDDLDLYVYRRDGAGKLIPVDASASAAGDEQVTLRLPEAGTYVAFVNGYDTGRGGGYAYTAWTLGSADLGNLAISPNPTTAAIATPLSLTATWTGLTAGQRYLGWLGYTGPDGLAEDITVVSIG